MKRRMAVALGIALAVQLVTVTAQAQAAPRVRVILGSTYIEGEGLAPSAEVTATLAGSAGDLKGACLALTDSSGDFNCSWGQGGLLGAGLLPPATNEPGDRVSVGQGGSTYASGPLADVRLEELDPATDRVVGVVVPRRPRVRVSGGHNRRLTSTGIYPSSDYVKVGETDAGGAFDVDLTSAGNPIRNDTVFVGAVQGTFEVGLHASFPGFDIQKDWNYGFLSGIPGTTHTVRLHGPGGGIKSEAEVRLGLLGGFPSSAVASQRVGKAAIGRGGAMGVFFFEDAAGRPVRILEGDVIAVGGAGAFAFKVPKLTPGMNASRFAVRTLPNRPIYFRGRIVVSATTSTYYDVYGKTDGTGLFQYDPAPAITPYSTAAATITVDGNYVSTSRTLAP